MNAKSLVFLTICLLILYACNFQSSTNDNSPDSSLIEPDDINANYIDSVLLNNYSKEFSYLNFHREEIQAFYARRKYQSVWFNNSGMIEQGSLFVNQLQSTSLELTDSISGLSKIIQMYEQYESDSLTTRQKHLLDVLLTHAFLDFADKKWRGMSENAARDLGWYIKRKRLEISELLDSIITNPEYFTYYKPLNRQYDLLREYLVRLKTIETQGGLPFIDTIKKSFRKGDTSYVVRKMRVWLYKTGFLLNNDTTNKRYDDTLMRSVKLLQHSFGLEEDGIAGKSVISRMNVSLNTRMQQLLVNLERLRWVESVDTGRHILINIPRFKLYAYRNDTLDWQCNVVVGTTQNKTSIFNGTIRYVVLNPYWNIPNSILFNEVLPAYRKDKSYFTKHNMEILSGNTVVNPDEVKWNEYNVKNCPVMVRQLPGKDNPLGVVKFLFPNSYNIYLHDSPAKQYFEKNKRTFSHGCIRVGEPLKLMQWVLLKEKLVTPDKINSIFGTGKETYINLQQGVPVTIAYYTAWIDEHGRINFADDVYKLDEEMKKVLFKKTTDQERSVTAVR